MRDAGSRAARSIVAAKPRARRIKTFKEASI
jgi:hypothetical protein